MEFPYPYYIPIPSGLMGTIPSLDGKHFFIKPTDPADDYILDDIDIFSRNEHQQYHAPLLDFHWPQGSEIHQKFDNDLVMIQERQAHTTRPLDELAVEAYCNMSEPDTDIDLIGYIQHIRSQLSITARLIQQMRMDNYACALQGNSASTLRNEMTVFHHEFEASTEVESNGSGDNFPPAQSTINVSSNTLNVPEIRSEIGQYLAKPDWLNCALVCKDWNLTFSKLLYSSVCIRRLPYPSPKAIRKYGELVRHLRIDDLRFDLSLCTSFLPNLRSFECVNYCYIIDTVPNLIAMMQSCREITHLRISVFAGKGAEFWRAISGLTHLEQLDIYTYRAEYQGIEDDSAGLRKELQGLWDACGGIKNLKISDLQFFQNVDGSEHFSKIISSLEFSKALCNRTFPHLRQLFIKGISTSVTSQAKLIACCPNLEHLKWYDDGDDNGHTQELCQYFNSGNSPNLKSLHLVASQREDVMLADLFRSLDGRLLEGLRMPFSAFGEYSCKEIYRFFPTLRALDLQGCEGLSSTSAVEILVLYPNLEDVTLGRVYARDLDPKQSWACYRKLRSLKIAFDLDPSPAFDGSTISLETQDALCDRVYSTLGQLREIKHLAFDDGFGYISLKLQLSKGFRRLAGLKKLEHFEITPTLSIGQQELNWMIVNWPKLKQVSGVYNIAMHSLTRTSFNRKGIKID
ncbi:hypothetical protein BGZ49_004127 [Haplosporangium sp. Z 27]|nr:hypothetical protein BGZ49_004127 [Haplosporangium sp. Z 27]